MDWVETAGTPRFPGGIDPHGLGDTAPITGASSVLSPDQRVLANIDSGWGGSSQSIGWQAPVPNLTGWPSGAGAPQSTSLSSQAPAPEQSSLGEVEESSGISLSPDASPAEDRANGNPLSLLHHAQNGRATELPAPSYSSGTLFDAVGDRGIVALTGQGTAANTTPEAMGDVSEIHSTVDVGAGLPSQTGGESDGLPTPSASTNTTVIARPTPKKKPARPRAPKKKVKPQAAPIRRTRKVKKPRPPDVPLGAGGRERAMALLRALVNSPLSEEFRKPVIQLHPELAERYTAVVRRPIDLTTVARRLRRGTYDNAAGRLRRDIIRIFSNCEKFNLTTSQLFVGIARDLRALFESHWAEACLPVPGEDPSWVFRRRALLRSARYRLCWGAQLRGPLREAARQAVRAASMAALTTGGFGALSVAQEFAEEVLPELAGDGEPSNEEWTLGLFAERACLALGLRATHPPPEEPEDLGVGVLGALTGIVGLSGNGTSLALNNGNEKAGRDACAEWLFGPRQAAWLAGETASGNTSTACAAVVVAAWRALDEALSPATVLVASHASRGTEFSSVWARPDKLVWAKQAKNVYWPAMLLWGSGTTAALKEVNMCRVPPAFREELEKQAKANKGNNRGGAVVEFFGAHEFALLKPDALQPLLTLDKSPNKSLSKNKRWRPTMEEAVKAFAALQDLDEAMYQEQSELAQGLGFVLETLPEEVGTVDTDTGTSSGDSMCGSDSECSDVGSISSQRTPEASTATAAVTPATTPQGTAASFSPTSIWSAHSPRDCHLPKTGGGVSVTSINPMSPPQPRPCQSLNHSVTVSGGANTSGGSTKPIGPKRRRKQSPECKAAAQAQKSKNFKKSDPKSEEVNASSAGGEGRANAKATASVPTSVVDKVKVETGARVSGANKTGGKASGGGASGAGSRSSGAVDEGTPACKKRPTNGLSRKERAMEKVWKYLEKYGDMFVRHSQRKVTVSTKEKEAKANLVKGKGQETQSSPPTPAAAAVLGQTGLWGRLMGGPDNTKAPQEETESTDGEDEDVGMIDSETPKTSAERKAALRRQQALLREDIENLNARAVLQENRLKGLGATIPPHEALQAKRDREWKEFLEGRAPEPTGKASHEQARPHRGNGGGKANGKSRALASIGSASSNNARTPKTPSQNASVKVKTSTPTTNNTGASSGDQRPERTGGGRAYGSSSFRGVNLNGNRWLARISQDGKKKSLGGYATEEEAAHAYDRAALQLFGPNAITNFKDGKRVHPEKGARSSSGSSRGGGSGASRGGLSQASSERGTVTASAALENGKVSGERAPRADSSASEASPKLTPAKRRMSPEPNKSKSPVKSSTPRISEPEGKDEPSPLTIAGAANVDTKPTSNVEIDLKQRSDNTTIVAEAEQSWPKMSAAAVEPRKDQVADTEDPMEVLSEAEEASPPVHITKPEAKKPQLPSLIGRFQETRESPQTAVPAPLSPHAASSPSLSAISASDEIDTSAADTCAAARETVTEAVSSPREDGERTEQGKTGQEGGRISTGTSSNQAMPHGYMHLFPGHGGAPGAAYGHPGYPGSPGVRVSPEGAIWPGPSGHGHGTGHPHGHPHGHPTFNPFTAAYGYPFGTPAYGQAPHAPGLPGSEGSPSHGAHGHAAVTAAAVAAATVAAQRAHQPSHRNVREVAGYPAGAPGTPGYGVYGAHQAAMFHGKVRSAEEAGSMGGAAQGENERSFEESSQSGHVSGAVRRVRSSQLNASASEHEANALPLSPPPPGYNTAVMNMLARHAYGHNAHVQAQMAAAAQAAALTAAVAAATAAGGNAAERLVYSHHHPAGGRMYMSDAPMGHYRGGRAVEAPSSAGGSEDMEGPVGLQQEGYDLYSLPAPSPRYSPRAQAQQQASPAESAPGSVPSGKTAPQTDPEHRW